MMGNFAEATEEAQSLLSALVHALREYPSFEVRKPQVVVVCVD